MKLLLHPQFGYLSLLVVCLFLSPLSAFEQQSSKSILINHGSNNCGSVSPEQHFFKGIPGSPSLLTSCNIGIDYAQVYITYNPADHKIYLGKTNSGGTKFYAVDFNLTGTLTCPPPLGAPTYDYTQSFQHVFFNNRGDIYGIHNYRIDASTNQLATLSQINITTGLPIPGTEKTIHFPSGSNAPNGISGGDIAFLPNGRTFIMLSSNPSKLYELINNGPNDISAIYLQNIPQNCFGLSFLDGQLLLSGYNSSSCYYYVWDIKSASLSPVNTFPASKNSIDLSSMTVAVGCSKELIGSTNINENTARIYYRIVVKNKGNILLNNVQLSDDLVTAFGATNISDVVTSFAYNPAGLVLNPGYNGTTDINLLAANQVLNNFPVESDSSVIDVSFTATDLKLSHIYKNSAIASGNVGAGVNFLEVSDSSNNGNHTRIDPNNNGVSDDWGENIPTPFIFNSVLPEAELSFHGSKYNKVVKLSWKNLRNKNVNQYKIERSVDGRSFSTIYTSTTSDRNVFEFLDDISQIKVNTIYYRLRISDIAGITTFSNVLKIYNSSTSLKFAAYPNPFSNYINIQYHSVRKTSATIVVRDVTNRIIILSALAVEKGDNFFQLPALNQLQAGTYLLEIITDTENRHLQLVKQ